MRIIDLAPEFESTYLACLKDWDNKMVSLGSQKRCWYEKMKSMGLRVKLAVDNVGRAMGMIQYIPIEWSRATGRDLYFIQCIWVYDFNKGIGNQQGKGIGKALLQNAEENAKILGAKGIAAWGLKNQASWFRAQGFTDADIKGVSFLLWKSFSDDAKAPRWIQPQKTPEATPGKITVTIFLNGWCTDTYEIGEFARKAVATFDDKVVIQEIDTADSQNLQEWGIENALFIDNDCVWSYPDNPPLTFEQIRNQIEQKLSELMDLNKAEG